MEPDLASLIEAAEKGNESEAATLFSALYDELHRIAKRELVRRGAPPVSLRATPLLHTAYIEMAGKDIGLLPDRARFMGQCFACHAGPIN